MLSHQNQWVFQTVSFWFPAQSSARTACDALKGMAVPLPRARTRDQSALVDERLASEVTASPGFCIVPDFSATEARQSGRAKGWGYSWSSHSLS
eukprot:CAMPEP_0168385188 /NCGR_PEP_ID=MMETSP0228-20121227/14795_1 /TAXON_ID=133427 /ORGANISM="Protoceratium reticulatum, Strain CCCM 535 (=CCMP 1889)" /LENGTH=93 /DNA_ID=CAMNT_0008398373 /DNA_START=379 /DNA_END=657 /DNA_ORIENTATION=+